MGKREQGGLGRSLKAQEASARQEKQRGKSKSKSPRSPSKQGPLQAIESGWNPKVTGHDSKDGEAGGAGSPRSWALVPSAQQDGADLCFRKALLLAAGRWEHRRLICYSHTAVKAAYCRFGGIVMLNSYKVMQWEKIQEPGQKSAIQARSEDLKEGRGQRKG